MEKLWDIIEDGEDGQEIRSPKALLHKQLHASHEKVAIATTPLGVQMKRMLSEIPFSSASVGSVGVTSFLKDFAFSINPMSGKSYSKLRN